MSIIKTISAKEIKDSRDKPTIEVTVETDDGLFSASVPSGKSTGKDEALELRDEDGKGVSKAIEHVNTVLNTALQGKDCREQRALDELMIELDGTENKSKLGANTILGVSMALTRAGSFAKKIPLYAYIAELSGYELKSSSLPYPMFNIINGGAHAENELAIQEFMVVPQKDSFAENVTLGSKIFQNLTELVKEKFGAVPQLGDEGGYAPMISSAQEALGMLKSAMGEEQHVNISLDCAASEFFQDGLYTIDGKELSRAELVEFYKDLVTRFNIITIEDPFSEEDWEGFQAIHAALPEATIIGDDLTTTNIKKIKEAQEKNACNGVLIKLNQIGSVSETIDAINLTKSYGWKVAVSHRSGETMDDFIADLAAGTGADFLKSGSPAKPERMVKYRRLLDIEKELKE